MLRGILHHCLSSDGSKQLLVIMMVVGGSLGLGMRWIVNRVLRKSQRHYWCHQGNIVFGIFRQMGVHSYLMFKLCFSIYFDKWLLACSGLSFYVIHHASSLSSNSWWNSLLNWRVLVMALSPRLGGRFVGNIESLPLLLRAVTIISLHLKCVQRIGSLEFVL